MISGRSGEQICGSPLKINKNPNKRTETMVRNLLYLLEEFQITEILGAYYDSLYSSKDWSIGTTNC